VRIVDRFAPGVVLAVNRHPFFRHHAGGQPQPEAEEMADDRVQVERVMRLVPMQIDGHRGDGDVGQYQRRQQCAPDAQIEQATRDVKRAQLAPLPGSAA